MPSSYSASLRFELQFTGENINLWGEKLNSALQRVDSAIAGWLTKALTATPYALTTANGSEDEARTAMIKFTGAAGPWTVTIPGVSKSYLIWNATSGIVTITTGAGATVSIDSGDIVTVICDGTNVKTPGYSGLSIKEYVAAAVIGATGSLPATAGNSGKFLYSDGSSGYWKYVQTADIPDFDAEVTRRAIIYSLIF